MPMSSAQLADLVTRARLKPPPVPNPPPAPPPRAVQTRQAKPAPQASSTTRTVPKAGTQTTLPKNAAAPPVSPPSSQPEPAAAEAADFPIGWELSKESWHFHRRFYAIFRRPMHRGEYSHLLWQIRRRRGEHLIDDCWRVTLPDGRRSLAVRGTQWRLITILPKNWQPPRPVREHAEIETSAA